MLQKTLKSGEGIRIGDDIVITAEVRNRRVVLRIDAPRSSFPVVTIPAPEAQDTE